MLSQAPGTAVMISHAGIRYTQSAQCFDALQTPPGSRKEHFEAGLDLSQAREHIAREMSGEWLFFVDDDAMFAPDLLQRLLQRLDANPDVDAVSAYILRRWPPHYTVAGRLRSDGQADILNFDDASGLVRVDLTGLGGGAVIRKSAFDRVQRPWFTGGTLTEDWTFCSRLLQVGGQPAVDLDVHAWHITPFAVLPTREDNGQWGVAYVPVRPGSQAMVVGHVTAASKMAEEPVAV